MTAILRFLFRDRFAFADLLVILTLAPWVYAHTGSLLVTLIAAILGMVCIINAQHALGLRDEGD